MLALHSPLAVGIVSLRLDYLVEAGPGRLLGPPLEGLLHLRENDVEGGLAILFCFPQHHASVLARLVVAEELN